MCGQKRVTFRKCKVRRFWPWLQERGGSAPTRAVGRTRPAGLLQVAFLTMRTFIIVFQGFRTEHWNSKRSLGCLLECVSSESLKLGFSKLILYHTSVSLIKWLKHSKENQNSKKIMKIDFANFVFELHRLVTSIAGKSGLSAEVSREESEPVSDQPRQHDQPAKWLQCVRF